MTTASNFFSLMKKSRLGLFSKSTDESSDSSVKSDTGILKPATIGFFRQYETYAQQLERLLLTLLEIDSTLHDGLLAVILRFLKKHKNLVNHVIKDADANVLEFLTNLKVSKDVILQLEELGAVARPEVGAMPTEAGIQNIKLRR